MQSLLNNVRLTVLFGILAGIFFGDVLYGQEGYILFDPGHDMNNVGAQGACQSIYEWQLTYSYGDQAYLEATANYFNFLCQWDWVPRITRLQSTIISNTD